MTRYAFSIDLDRCVGCQACTVGCKTGNERPLGDSYIRVHDIVSGKLPNLFGSFSHHRCFHCADAACVTVCPTGALSKADNGMTAVDQGRCSGCGYCTAACPYKIPTLAAGRVSKCVACAGPVQEGESPYCVQTCPSQAIQYGERDAILAALKTRVAALKARHPNAQVYGETQLGGLGLLTLLLDDPQVYGLPEQPSLPQGLAVWQRGVQPLMLPAVGLSAAFTGLAFVIARRQHVQHRAASVTPLQPPTENAATPGAELAPTEPPPAVQEGGLPT